MLPLSETVNPLSENRKSQQFFLDSGIDCPRVRRRCLWKSRLPQPQLPPPSHSQNYDWPFSVPRFGSLLKPHRLEAETFILLENNLRHFRSASLEIIWYFPLTPSPLFFFSVSLPPSFMRNIHLWTCYESGRGCVVIKNDFMGSRTCSPELFFSV